MGNRIAEIKRKTKETDIKLSINLDGSGICNLDVEIGFFKHMLDLFAHHSGFDMDIKLKGDTEVDAHHSVEDTAIVLGKAISTALGDKKGIKRYADISIPMDEVLCNVSVDVSGRPYLVYNAEMQGSVGEFDLELVEEFMRALVINAGITLHINIMYGSNSHHKAEAIFKGVARSLRKAVKVVGNDIPSSKGLL